MSDQSLHTLYATVLRSRIVNLEGLRREAFRHRARMLLVTVVPAALFMSAPFLATEGVIPDTSATRLLQVGFVTLVLGAWLVVTRFDQPALAAYATYLAHFKEDLRAAGLLESVWPHTRRRVTVAQRGRGLVGERPSSSCAPNHGAIRPA